VTGGEAVLLRPVVSEYDALTSFGRVAAQRSLVDAGDHVVWHDGELTQRWTVPDQPARPGMPVLSAVVVADTQFWNLRTAVWERYVFLTDDAGGTLAVLARITDGGGTTYEPVDFDRVWPPDGFDGLVARGVAQHRESFPDLRALDKAHPRAVARGRAIVGSRALTWTWWGVLAGAAIALGFQLLAG
jgi:hypothetical protein